MDDNGGPRHISVSRDALRADLAELELRLRAYLGAELALKASADAVDRLSDRVTEIERSVLRIDAEGSREAQVALGEINEVREGRFPESFRLALREFALALIAEHVDGARSHWRRVAAILLVCCAVVSVSVAVAATAHGWGR